ncbi:MAG: flagellar basal body rod C-terminal domain-containing protein [Candidatus Anammoxibacter sp.]
MISTSISQSGIKAANDALRVSANNVANINTNGFKKDIVNFRDVKGGGVKANVSKSNEPGAPIETDDGTIEERSNVNLVEEIVNQIVAKHQVTANVTALKTGLETDSEILDILA